MGTASSKARDQQQRRRAQGIAVAQAEKRLEAGRRSPPGAVHRAIAPGTLSRLWLHQANRHMNDLIARRVLGQEPAPDQAPIILDRYANTSSAGSIIAFHLHHQDLEPGATGVVCSFGAGYSAGCVVIRRD